MQNCTNYYKAILENKVEYDMKEQNNIEGTGDKTSLKCKGVSISLNCGTSAVKPPVTQYSLPPPPESHSLTYCCPSIK